MRVLIDRLVACTVGLSMLLLAPAAGMAQGAAPKRPGADSCSVCELMVAERVCDGPLSRDDSALDPIGSSYMPEVLRVVATAMAIDMARKLQAVYGKHPVGRFGDSYKAHEEALGALAKRGSEIASSSEVSAVKVVRSALYCDAAIALRTASKAWRSPKLLESYKGNQKALEELAAQPASDYTLTRSQRAAVCEVLGAYASK